MRNTFKMLAAASAFAVAAVAPQAAAADFDVAAGPNYTVAPADGGGEATFNVVGDPFNGPVSGSIGRAGVLAGTWTDRFIFRIGQDGLGSGSITTTFSGMAGNSTDLDFLSATFSNGVSTFVVPLASLGNQEFGGLSNIPIFAGNENVLTIEYLSRGDGSFGGQLNFIPNAVPEPATWALMLFGFAGIGMMMRRRRKQDVRVKYAF